MSAAPTLLTAAGDATDATSWTTASHTPPTDKVVYFAVHSVFVGTPNTPTITGNSTTYVQVATILGTNQRLTLFRANPSAPTTGTAVIDFAAQTQLRGGWSVFYWDDVDTSGSDGAGSVVQTKTATATGTAGTADFDAAFTDPVNNVTLSVLGKTHGDAISPDMSPVFAELSDTQAGAEFERLEVMWRLGEEQTPRPTWVTSAVFVQIAVEVAGLVPAAAPYPYIGGGYYPVEG